MCVKLRLSTEVGVARVHDICIGGDFIGRFAHFQFVLDMKTVLIIVSVAIVSAWIPSTFAGESNGGGKSRQSAMEDVSS